MDETEVEVEDLTKAIEEKETAINDEAPENEAVEAKLDEEAARNQKILDELDTVMKEIEESQVRSHQDEAQRGVKRRAETTASSDIRDFTPRS